MCVKFTSYLDVAIGTLKNTGMLATESWTGMLVASIGQKSHLPSFPKLTKLKTKYF